jgi:hypothetical protein
VWRAEVLATSCARCRSKPEVYDDQLPAYPDWSLFVEVRRLTPEQAAQR